jgi:hypothetical protein
MKKLTQGQINQRDRAKKAVTILDKYYDPGEHRTNVVDMLTDLRHLCDVKGINLYEALDASYEHYQAERKGED